MRSANPEICTHDAARYNGRHDNFYCIHCGSGMGEAFYIVAKQNMTLEKDNARLKAKLAKVLTDGNR